MKNTNYQKKAYRWSLLMYYGTFILALAAGAIGYNLQEYTGIIEKTTETVVSSISYIYLLCAIPFALWFFSKQVEKLGKEEDDDERYRKYMKLAGLRIGMIAVVFVVNIVLFYLLHSYSFLYAAGIGAVALLFCKPREEDITTALSKDEPMG